MNVSVVVHHILYHWCILSTTKSAYHSVKDIIVISYQRMVANKNKLDRNILDLFLM